ncbi:hypothetical protein AgCh_022655 [Apium graveolens]
MERTKGNIPQKVSIKGNKRQVSKELRNRGMGRLESLWRLRKIFTSLRVCYLAILKEKGVDQINFESELEPFDRWLQTTTPGLSKTKKAQPTKPRIPTGVAFKGKLQNRLNCPILSFLEVSPEREKLLQQIQTKLDHLAGGFKRSFLHFGYEVSFEALDKGAIEILGPYGISYTFRRLAERISQLQSGFVVRRVRYDPWPPSWWGWLLRYG